MLLFRNNISFSCCQESRKKQYLVFKLKLCENKILNTLLQFDEIPAKSDHNSSPATSSACISDRLVRQDRTGRRFHWTGFLHGGEVNILSADFYDRKGKLLHP